MSCFASCGLIRIRFKQVASKHLSFVYPEILPVRFIGGIMCHESNRWHSDRQGYESERLLARCTFRTLFLESPWLLL